MKTEAAAPVIKICGITSHEDAEHSIRLGATAIGLNFYPSSPRFLGEERAGEILDGIPEHILKVGVFVGLPADTDLFSRLDVLQLHGLQGEHEIPDLDRTIWVAASPDKVGSFPNFKILIDVSWGTGRRADWEALSLIRRPFLLSSGLTPDNVEEAILRLRPRGVDVCSGVESRPGVKDPDKLATFIANARAAFEALGRATLN